MRDRHLVMDTFAHIRARIVNRAAMASAYQGWSDDFARAELARAFSPTDQDGREIIEPLTLEEIKQLNDAELASYGFMKWHKDLILIPLWLKNFIAGDPIVESILGDQLPLSKSDNDVRFGCLAFGFRR